MNSGQVSLYLFLKNLSPLIGHAAFANYSESSGVVTLSYWALDSNISALKVLKDLKITRTKLNEMYYVLLH